MALGRLADNELASRGTEGLLADRQFTDYLVWGKDGMAEQKLYFPIAEGRFGVLSSHLKHAPQERKWSQHQGGILDTVGSNR